MNQRILILFVTLLGLLSQALHANERITHFHSEIQVQADRSLTVTETISVVAENRTIRHGIYRDFPTIYSHPRWSHLGFRDKTGFALLEVELDEQDTPWHQERLDNGIRIYIGDSSRLVSPGPHQYQLSYTTTRQISHFRGDDVLLWNVNGQGWTLPTDRVSATVHLPGEADILDFAAWTGLQKDRGSDYLAVENTDGSISFSSSRAFAPGEGLTISLRLPPGTVTEQRGNFIRLLKDNWLWLSGLLLVLLLPLYYLKAWRAVGRDPEKGVVVADYHPVRGLSPAAHRYITANRSDDTTLSAALVNMGIKGYLKIEQTGKKTYLLHDTSSEQAAASGASLTPVEDVVHKTLFQESEQLLLGKEYNSTVAKASKSLDKLLKVEWRDTIYRDNQRYSWYGLLIGMAALLLCGLHLGNEVIQLSGLVPVAVFLFLGIGLTRRKFKVITLIPVAAFLFGGLRLSEFSLFDNGILTWLSLVVAALFILFNYLLKAPTPFGQKILDEIEGFRLYLATAEQNRLNILHPPEKTPELFEKLLPYAIALGVENEWSAQFSDILKRSAREKDGYRPGWYSGDYYRGYSGAGIASSLGTGLSSSVASSATAPGSSSGGFSGGGGAGSGGGGGGGGGW